MSNTPNKPGELSAGQWVEIRGMAGVARILEIDGRRHRARVLLHDQEWVVALKRLAPTERPDIPAPKNMVRVSGGAPPRDRIDLHGMRVEDALAEVDRALDQAVVNKLGSLKIIHGHGTGALRTAVRDLLTTHPHVAHYRFGNPMEGGLACTVAELRAARP